MDMQTKFNGISDDELQTNLQNLCTQERELHTEILHHLLEISRRRLFAKRAYPSLFEYCVKELGYSEGAAARRINTMRLMQELPEVEQKISEGKISLSTASSVQCFFKREKKESQREYSGEEKVALVEMLENKSRRETDRILTAISPEVARPDRERALCDVNTEIRFTADTELMNKLKRIRNLTAHRNPNPDYGELLHYMADMVLAKIDPEKKEVKRKSPQKTMSPPIPITSPTPPAESRSRYIPAAVKRDVVARDGWKCNYVDPDTGKKCGSTFGLEFEHIIPFGMGGESTAENLTILCKQHNLLAAEKAYGKTLTFLLDDNSP